MQLPSVALGFDGFTKHLERTFAIFREKAGPDLTWDAYFAYQRESLRRWTPALEDAHRAVMREEEGRVVPVLGAEELGAIKHGNRREPAPGTYPAIAAGPRAAKNGTLLTDSQVLRKLSRRVSAANPVARIPVQSPNTPRPQIITTAATSRPSGVIGTTSPYPVVVSVATAHHNVAGTLPKATGWTSRSRK